MAEARSAGAVPVTVPAAPSAGYEVRVGEGVWDDLPALLAERCPAHRYALIADERVAELYAERVLSTLRGAGLLA